MPLSSTKHIWLSSAWPGTNAALTVSLLSLGLACLCTLHQSLSFSPPSQWSVWSYHGNDQLLAVPGISQSSSGHPVSLLGTWQGHTPAPLKLGTAMRLALATQVKMNSLLSQNLQGQWQPRKPNYWADVTVGPWMRQVELWHKNSSQAATEPVRCG